MRSGAARVRLALRGAGQAEDLIDQNEARSPRNERQSDGRSEEKTIEVPLRDPSRAGHEAAGAALRAVPALRRAQAAAPSVRGLRLLPRSARDRGEGGGAALTRAR